MVSDQYITDCYSEEIAFSEITSFDQIMQWIYKDYLKRFKERFDNYLNYYKTIPLDTAIYNSALGKFENKDGEKKTWFHQQTFITHNGEEPLKELANKLSSLKSEIKKKNSFESLHDDIIKEASSNLENIGKLSIYDTAIRLGNHLGLRPKYLYLHAGTESGYKILIDEKINKTKVNPKIFKHITGLNQLEPIYLEDILCIYKKTFSKIKCP